MNRFNRCRQCQWWDADEAQRINANDDTEYSCHGWGPQPARRLKRDVDGMTGHEILRSTEGWAWPPTRADAFCRHWKQFEG